MSRSPIYPVPRAPMSGRQIRVPQIVGGLSPFVTTEAIVPLGASTATSIATLALTAKTAVPLAASAAQSSATLALTAPTQVPLGTSAAVSTASLTVSTPTPAVIPLATAAATSTGTLSLRARTTIPLGTSAAVLSPTLVLTVPATQFARPVADIAAAGWVVAPLWSKLDEVAADDADLVTGVAVP